jgi:hypothetical protein
VFALLGLCHWIFFQRLFIPSFRPNRFEKNGVDFAEIFRVEKAQEASDPAGDPVMHQTREQDVCKSEFMLDIMNCFL